MAAAKSQHADSRGRYTAPFFWLLALLTAPAAAHNARYDLRVEMQAPQIPGVLIELHQDSLLAPQLAIANRSGRPLEILDDDGRAFLRIGPSDAQADVAAAAFHASRISGGATPPPRTLSDTPRWRRVSRTAEYGWFDPRIATGPVEIPRAIYGMGREMPFGEWNIPLRLGNETLTLRGYFVYTPPAAGVVRSVLTATLPEASGIRVQLTPGATPALMLENKGKQVVSVLDSTGNAFLRISAAGVEARLDSPAWRASRADGQTEGQGWQRISSAPLHIWFDPRARYAGPPVSGSARRFGEWRIPLMIGSQPAELCGVYEWLPRSGQGR